MPTATSQDTEITLGTGKMLALFFGLVAVCAVFFGMGFSLGRSSVRIASPDLPAATTVTTGGQRPSAVKTTSAAAPADMTFYKAVESKGGDSQPVVKEAAAAVPETTAPTTAAARLIPPRQPHRTVTLCKSLRSARWKTLRLWSMHLRKSNIPHSQPIRRPTSLSTCRSGRMPTSKMPS